VPPVKLFKSKKSLGNKRVTSSTPFPTEIISSGIRFLMNASGTKNLFVKFICLLNRMIMKVQGNFGSNQD